jgi:hypothetical protein
LDRYYNVISNKRLPTISPDDTRTFEKHKLELTTFKKGTSLGRISHEPG